MAPKPNAAQSRGGPGQTRTALREVPVGKQNDYFVQRDGLTFAGTHLLIDLWDAQGLSDRQRVESALREAATACGATLLNLYTHHFGEGGGVSGVAVLAESHISIHTWPERGYAAIDIFMCGDCNPHAAIPVLKRVFSPASMQLAEQKRGIVP